MFASLCCVLTAAKYQERERRRGKRKEKRLS